VFLLVLTRICASFRVGIMDMMKDMYEDGDENMRKVIGEAMLKSQRGEKAAPPSMDGLDDM
jgi:hypothetical protein